MFDTDMIENEKTLIDRLGEWVRDPEKRFFALTGDYGTGKTFTLRVFSKIMMQDYDKDKSLPAPFYIDLKRVENFVVSSDGTRVPSVTDLIRSTLIYSQNDDFTPHEILQMHKEGDVILLFDGLDEMMVHYTEKEENIFLRGILGLVEGEDNIAKMIVSYRDNYFERAEAQYHGDISRFCVESEGVDSSIFSPIFSRIKPFGYKEQGKLLKNILGEEEGIKMVKHIKEHPCLTLLSGRPVFLTKIAALYPKLEELEKSGIGFNCSEFYKVIIDDMFLHDRGKSLIHSRHKKLIFENLAFLFFQKNVVFASIDEVNDWLAMLFTETPILSARYNYQEDGALIEKDIRTSGFLSHFYGSLFSFSHSSFYDYFLTEYLIKHSVELPKEEELSLIARGFLAEKKDMAAVHSKLNIL